MFLCGQRMIGRGDDHQRIFHERLRLQVQIGRRLAHHHQVDLIFRELHQQFIAIGNVQIHLHPGETLAKCTQ